MFENVLGQAAADQIVMDIESRVLAPSMLFWGPPGTGKGTSALELARVLSCETDGAPWNCSCRNCEQHRLIAHPDLIIMGSRLFSAEILAASDTFLRNRNNAAVRLLFIRSVQKLLARFSPVLWEDDPKIEKVNETITKLTEDLNELMVMSRPGESGEKDGAALEKLAESISAKSIKLENDGISEFVPVAQIRRASAWSRLAPSGKHKVLLIEQADKMQDPAFNSLLKILEEPPESLSLILCTTNSRVILPTLLSRLRPYRFMKRDKKTEAEVVRRVFRAELPENLSRDSGASAGENRIHAYLESFLLSGGDNLYPLAAYFAASVAASAVMHLRMKGIHDIPGYIIDLGRYAAPIAEANNLGRPSGDIKTVSSVIMKGSSNFETRNLFSVFLAFQLEIISSLLRSMPGGGGADFLSSCWKKNVRDAGLGVYTFNQNPAAALERLFIELRNALAGPVSVY